MSQLYRCIMAIRFACRIIPFLVFLISISGNLAAQDTATLINNVTGLYSVKVNGVLRPTSTSEIVEAVKNHPGPISIGGGRYSMGGQTATEHALQIDMRRFNRVLNFSKQRKEITVQTGITWRDLLKYIDTANLSVSIMQSYGNFTVGGSLSVNAHGRYVHEGPIIRSVKQIKLVLANGDEVEASRTKNSELFYGAIGGYGALGVITETTLLLDENEKVERTDVLMAANEYKEYFIANVRGDTSIIFHNGDIYPNGYNKIRAVSFKRTKKELTNPNRLAPVKESYSINKFMYHLISEHSFGTFTRQHIIDPLIYIKKPVEWRNYEASANVEELEPASRRNSTYVLQEYFVPVENFDSFYNSMKVILKDNKVNVINISIRYANADTATILSWARKDVFSFVIYYKQGTREKDKEHVKVWTRLLIDEAIANNGTYYLPYQIHATPAQFAAAYPTAVKLFDLKRKVDPTNKFRNKLWDAYFIP